MNTGTDVKFVPVLAINAYAAVEVITPRILNLGSKLR
jgi:hypothetical protein